VENVCDIIVGGINPNVKHLTNHPLFRF